MHGPDRVQRIESLAAEIRMEAHRLELTASGVSLARDRAAMRAIGHKLRGVAKQIEEVDSDANPGNN